MTSNDKITKLEVIVAGYAATIGKWSVEECDDSFFLTHALDEKDWPEDAYGDEPFIKWGGNEIMKQAEMSKPDDSGCDNGQDKYGDTVICNWVEWKKEEAA